MQQPVCNIVLNCHHRFVLLLTGVTLFLLISFPTIAQENQNIEVADTLYRVEMSDGNVFIGEMVELNKDRIILKSESIGQITLHMKFVVKIEQIIDSEISHGDIWYRHIQSARYFFSPNGYGLKQGESYYQNTWIFLNQFSLGVTDHFSIGIGLVPLFFFDFAPTPIWITPKISIPVVKEKINLGGGALLGIVAGEGGAPFGITFATATFGPHDKNVTFGFGYAFGGGESASAPLINFGGLVRITKNSYLMTENYIITNSGTTAGISILGGRSMINKSAIDYGLAFPIVQDLGGFLAIPWLGLTVPFSKSR